MARVTKQQKNEAIEHLRTLLPPGSTVYTVNVHTSSSGMTRSLKCYVSDKTGIHWVSCYWIAAALGWTVDEKREAVKVSGCGMDMGHHLVNALSYALHGTQSKGDGAKPENQGRPFTPRRGRYRAGYSLNHRWL